MARGMLVRNRLRERSNAALMIQRNWKRHLAERKYNKVRKTVIAIQSYYRGDRARKKYCFFILLFLDFMFFWSHGFTAAKSSGCIFFFYFTFKRMYTKKTVFRSQYRRRYSIQ